MQQQWYLPTVVDTALALRCEFGILGKTHFTDDGYQYLIFLIAPPAKQTLRQFVQQVGETMPLFDWYAIDHRDIDEYNSLTQLAQAQRTEALSSFYSGVGIIAGYNRELRRKLQRQAIRQSRWWYKLWQVMKRSRVVLRRKN